MAWEILYWKTDGWSSQLSNLGKYMRFYLIYLFEMIWNHPLRNMQWMDSGIIVIWIDTVISVILSRSNLNPLYNFLFLKFICCPFHEVTLGGLHHKEQKYVTFFPVLCNSNTGVKIFSRIKRFKCWRKCESLYFEDLLNYTIV